MHSGSLPSPGATIGFATPNGLGPYDRPHNPSA